jgi:DNA-binding NarL/FixJ family response regulator
VHAGETVVDPDLIRELLDAPRSVDPLEPLTAREREVLDLIAEGRTGPPHRRRLVVAPKTVEAHVRSIFRKLDLPTAHTETASTRTLTHRRRFARIVAPSRTPELPLAMAAADPGQVPHQR